MILQPQPSLSVKPPQPVESARQQIERLVPERLAGRRIDAVRFVEELLAIVTQVGELWCGPAGDQGLRFEIRGHDPFEVGLDANRSKLRMLCARLAVLCQDENGSDSMLYGGEGTIRRTFKAGAFDEEPSNPIRYHLAWKARWSNTPDKHEFAISTLR
jgi:hypothetical protein